jgi:hypothetical protein
MKQLEKPNVKTALRKFLFGRMPADDVARAYARCFGSRDGQLVLEHLHHITVFRVTDPVMDNKALRQLEGQRQLVLFICQQLAKAKTIQ